MQIPSFIKNIGITGKLIGLISAILFIVLSASAFNTYRSFTKKLSNDANVQVKTGINAIGMELDEIKEVIQQVANDQAIRPNFVTAISEGNIGRLTELGRKLLEKRPNAEIAFFDSGENLLVRVSNSQSQADSSGSDTNKIYSKNGKAGFRVVNEDIILEATSPVFNGERQVGYIVILDRPFKDHVLVDKLKEKLGLEVTMFRNNIRLSTTVKNEGKRAIGTEMKDEKVLSTVLQQLKTYYGEANVVGIPHTTAYAPLKDSDGKAIGMIFAGISKASIMEAIIDAFIDEVIFQIPLNLLILAITILILRRSITIPLTRVTQFAEGVAGGNLEAKLEMNARGDELGKLGNALTQMVDNLKVKITEIEQKAQEAEEATRQAEEATRQAEEARAEAVEAKKHGLLEAAEKLEHIVQGIVSEVAALTEIGGLLNRAVDEQAGKTDGAATAMEEMNSTVLEVARNSGNAAQGSEETKAQAHVGADAMKSLLQHIFRAQELSVDLSSMMKGLNDSAKDINGIISVIDDIADQTNLLALNAAIEAARAGDAGRGFAVVADEVRKLAEKTQKATQEVGRTIKDMQDRVQKGVGMVENMEQSAKTATDSATTTQEALGQIVTMVDSTADGVRSIATAAEQQSATSEEINRSIAEIHDITQGTRENVGQVMNAVGQVKKMANELMRIQSGLRRE